MPAMTKEDRDAILGSFALLDLEGQLDSVVENLEKTAPQVARNFRSIEREFSDEVRERVMRLMRQNVGDPQVQATLLKVIRLGREALDAERAELAQLKDEGHDIAARQKGVEWFAKFLQEKIAKPVMEAISDVWYGTKVKHE